LPGPVLIDPFNLERMRMKLSFDLYERRVERSKGQLQSNFDRQEGKKHA
jgi:hypothetical protein